MNTVGVDQPQDSKALSKQRAEHAEVVIGVPGREPLGRMGVEPSEEGVFRGVVQILDALSVRTKEFIQLRFGLASDAQPRIVPCSPESAKDVKRKHRLSPPPERGVGSDDEYPQGFG